MSELEISLLNARKNMLFFGEIYTAGKDFTLLPVVTNLTVKNNLYHVDGVGPPCVAGS